MNILKRYNATTQTWEDTVAVNLVTIQKNIANNNDIIYPRTAIFANTSGGSFALNLPSNPNVGDHIQIVDSNNSFATNNLTINYNGNPINSKSENLICNVSGVIVDLVYTGVTGWVANNAGGYIDWAKPISINTATTLSIGKHHVISDLSSPADYTVTLPNVSGNAGKLVSIELSGSLTKFITIDGYGSNTIDGSANRIMWKSETAILLCNGVSWTKIAGKSIPMFCTGSLGNFSQTASAFTYVKTAIVNTVKSNINLVVNNEIVPVRPGLANVMGSIAIGNGTSQAAYARIYVSDSEYQDCPTPVSAGYPANANVILGHGIDLGTTKYKLFCTSSVANPANMYASLYFEEVLVW